MAVLTVGLCRTDSTASPAALVAAWLIDALASVDGVVLTCSESDLIMLDITPLNAGTPIRKIVNRALAESRFAGWQIIAE